MLAICKQMASPESSAENGVMSDLVERVREASSRWQLQVRAPLDGGSRSTVVAASDAQGRDLVLKLPATRNAAHAEAAALRDWAGSGAAVVLVDATPDALLLLRSRPGVLMPWRPEGGPTDRLAAVTELLRRLWFCTPGRYRYPTLAKTYPDNERTAREDAASERRRRDEPFRGEAGLARLPIAAASAERLISTASKPTLLHGDFITKNLVSDAAGPVGWAVLDPIPTIGEAAAEVAAFAAYHPAESILPVAEALAHEVGVDPGRVLSWTAIWSVHQAAQAWRDDQEQLDELITSAPVGRLLRTWPRASRTKALPN